MRILTGAFDLRDEGIQLLVPLLSVTGMYGFLILIHSSDI